jgi:hypothetical protein
MEVLVVEVVDDEVEDEVDVDDVDDVDDIDEDGEMTVASGRSAAGGTGIATEASSTFSSSGKSSTLRRQNVSENEVMGMMTLLPFDAADHVAVERSAFHDTEAVGPPRLDHAAAVGEHPYASDLKHCSVVVTLTMRGWLWGHDHAKGGCGGFETST